MRARSRRLDGATLVRLADGSLALAREGRMVWHPDHGFVSFGDDGDELGLGSLTSSVSNATSGLSSDANSLASAAGGLGVGPIGDLASSGSGALGSALGSADSALGSATGAIDGAVGTVDSYASQGISAVSSIPGVGPGLGSAAQGLLGQGQGALSGVVGQGTSAVQGALKGVTAQAGQIVGQVTNVLATAEGALSAADGIAASLEQGDYLSAGQQALKIVQQAASEAHSADKTLAAGAVMAAKFSAAGAAVGSVVPVIGNVIGAVVGAIIGFVAGVIDSLSGNVESGSAAYDDYSSLELTYEMLKDPKLFSPDWTYPKGLPFIPSMKPSGAWFSKVGQDDAKLKAAGFSNIGDLRGHYKNLYMLLTGKVNSDGSVAAAPQLKTIPNISRNGYWSTWPAVYKQFLGSGATASRLDFKSGIDSDEQPALDLFMKGNAKKSLAPVAGIDYALWIAQQPDGLKQLHGADVGLQASITPLMPMAAATVLYMPYVQVLAAPKKYSPLAIDATRQAAQKQGSQAGDQVAKALALSMPKDDLETLLHAYAFLDVQDITGQPPATVLNGGQNIAVNQTVWSPDGQWRLVLQPDQNLVVYDGASGPALWASNTVNSGADHASMQTDGNFVLYTKDNHPVWATNTAGNPGATLAFQDDSNLVVYDKSGKAKWSSGTVRTFANYPLLSYLVERSGIWSSVPTGSDTVKGLQTAIGQALGSQTKTRDDALALLRKWNDQDHFGLSDKRLSDLADKRTSWTGDPYKGKSPQVINQKIGLAANNAHDVAVKKIQHHQRAATAAKTAIATAAANKAAKAAVTPPPLATKKEIIAGGATLGVGALVFYVIHHFAAVKTISKRF